MEPSWPIDFAVERENVVHATANKVVVDQLHTVLVRCAPRPDLCPPALLDGLVGTWPNQNVPHHVGIKNHELGYNFLSVPGFA